VRRLIAILTLTGCASAGAPPGGPEDHAPPTIVAVSPDSGATRVGAKSVDFRFDEVVSDRPSGGKAELEQLFLVSPWDGSPRVRWHRTHIEVRPRRGFRENTAYRVTMLPGLADLRGNAMKEGRSIVFSTGEQFPRFSVLGRVFDWSAERPAPNAFVEAIALPDSIHFVGITDSLGAFDVGPLGEGAYLVRALIDQNDNRAVDRSEKWDTTRIAVSGVRTPIELRAIERDSEPPVIFDITAPDTLTLQITFDKPLDPNQPLTPALFRVQRADSSELQQLQVASMAAVERQRADSIRRADSVRAAAQPPGQRPPGGLVPGAPSSGRPSVGPPPPKPSLPPPPKGLLVRLNPSNPLRPGDTYRITARNVRNLRGNTREVTRTFTMAKPTTPPDSARRPPTDSVRRPPLGNRRGIE
jgi:hypothetical protein